MTGCIYIEDIAQHEGQQVTLQGWVTGRRSSGKILFLQFRDGTGFIQCVGGRNDIGDELFDRVDHLPIESAVRVTGEVRADARAPSGFELGLAGLEVVHEAEEYPIGRKEHGDSFLLDHRHLWIRQSQQFAVLRIRATIISAVREYLDGHGYLNIDTPILTPAACEGTTTLFETEYFDEKAYLTQSGQLYNEATAMAFGRVYCFGPALRAEKSKTRRHLIEFWQVEPEIAYATLEDILDIQEELVCFVVERLLRERKPEFAILKRDLALLERVKAPFPRVTYTEMVDLLHEKGVEFTWGDDFGAPDEAVISESFDRPVMVTRYPRGVKPFYMAIDPEDERLTLSVDMLAPEGYGEIVGGGERLADLATLEAAVDAGALPRADYEWYIDLRRYGSVPHGGFGMGIERLTTWVCGIHHIRETIAFPRMLNRLRP